MITLEKYRHPRWWVQQSVPAFLCPALPWVGRPLVARLWAPPSVAQRLALLWVPLSVSVEAASVGGDGAAA